MLEVGQTSPSDEVRSITSKHIPNLNAMVDEAKDVDRAAQEDNEVEL